MSLRLRTGVVVALLAAGFLTVTLNPPRAAAVTRAAALDAAAAYGRTHGYHVGIAVYDTWRGRIYGGGDSRGTFASESIVKVMIANRLIVQGRMHGSTARRAWKMITRSDDGIASAFYGSVGGDRLIHWIKQRYHVWNLGSRPSRAGWWGNTHITPRGLVRYYARMKHDRKVAPWLLNAMHHAKPYGSDGTYQFFGIPQATHGFAIKQGWGNDSDWCCTADFNTTGFVNKNRYAVAILARGPSSTYGDPIRSMLTRTARLLLPGGHFPDPWPRVTSLSMTKGRTAGGQRITVHGSVFTHVRAVRFGKVRGTAVDVLGPHRLRVTTPQHRPGRFAVRVVTGHGTSPVSAHFQFVARPTVTAVNPNYGPTTGGTAVTINGTHLGFATAVWFGGARATELTVNSSTQLTVTAPAHASGDVHVTVRTPGGRSAATSADVYTYE
jgi:hypothetical protein